MAIPAIERRILDVPGDALPRPHANCYWLIPGQLLAGEHPGAILRGSLRRAHRRDARHRPAPVRRPHRRRRGRRALCSDARRTSRCARAPGGPSPVCDPGLRRAVGRGDARGARCDLRRDRRSASRSTCTAGAASGAPAPSSAACCVSRALRADALASSDANGSDGEARTASALARDGPADRVHRAMVSAADRYPGAGLRLMRGRSDAHAAARFTRVPRCAASERCRSPRAAIDALDAVPMGADLAEIDLERPAPGPGRSGAPCRSAGSGRPPPRRAPCRTPEDSRRTARNRPSSQISTSRRYSGGRPGRSSSASIFAMPSWRSTRLTSRRTATLLAK